MSCDSPNSKDKSGPFTAQISTNFNNDIIKEVLKCNFSNPKTRITDDAVELMAHLTKTLVTEAALRAAKQSSLESNNRKITVENIESVLPQIMLDFP